VLIDTAAAPPPDAAAALLSDVGDRLPMKSDLEASLVIGPEGASGGRLEAYRAAGINRLVLRAGTLDSTVETALAAASALFASCGVDLIFGRPKQSPEAWQAELRRALDAGAHHISIQEHARAACSDPAVSEVLADLYQGACETLSAGGMVPYEIGNFALPGRESRHLRHGATGGDYLGVGPGAVGRIRVEGRCHALTQTAPAMAWLRALQRGAESRERVLRPAERRVELILTGLRLRAGIERAWFEPLAGRALEDAFSGERLTTLVEDGFVVLDRRGLRLSERGWPLCDAVLGRLLA